MSAIAVDRSAPRYLIAALAFILTFGTIALAAPQAQAQTQDPPPCITLPTDPDRGKRPICENTANLDPTITIVSGTSEPGSTVVVEISNWTANEDINLRFNDAGYLPSIPSGVIHSATADADGNATLNVTLPPQSDYDFLTTSVGTEYGFWLRFLSANPAGSYYRWLTLPDTDPEPDGEPEEIEVTVNVAEETGGLVLSVASGSVDLGTTQLSPDLSALVASGQLPTVSVADLRADNPGWNVSGQSSVFAGDAGEFSASHFGWEPRVISITEGQDVIAGAPVAPGVGLGDSKELGSAAAGSGRGTAVLGADLSLSLPTSTAPGGYTATLTITAI